MKISAKKIALIGVFTALSLIIFIVEAQFPTSGIGGIKLGLANVATMVAMLFIGRREAGIVLYLRIILAAAFYGTFVSFLFSLVGGTFAYLVMCLLMCRFDKKQIWVVSAFGGVFHNVGQLIAAGFISGTSMVITLFPYLLISGIVTGVLTGLITQRLWFSSLRKYCLRKE